MNDKTSITALMSFFGRAFHTENEVHPVFVDPLAKELMMAEEYEAVQGYILNGARFFEPDLDTSGLKAKDQSCKAFWLNNSGLFCWGVCNSPFLYF